MKFSTLIAAAFLVSLSACTGSDNTTPKQQLEKQTAEPEKPISHTPHTTGEKKDCERQKTDYFEIKYGYVQLPIPGTKVTSAYLKLTNISSEAVTIKAVNTPAAKFAELHESTIQNDKMVMRNIAALTLAPGEAVSFEKNAKHIMLMGLNNKLTTDDTVTLTFIINDDEEQAIQLPVMKDAYICPHSDKLMSGENHE